MQDLYHQLQERLHGHDDGVWRTVRFVVPCSFGLGFGKVQGAFPHRVL